MGGLATSAGGSGGTATQPPETIADGAISPDDPHLSYFGRWSWQDSKRPVASWGPVGVNMRFEGTRVIVRLEDEQANLGVEGTGNSYQYSLDGGDFKVLASTAATDYPLASGLADGPHSLSLVRRTESKWGKTTITGFQIDAGKRLLDAGPRPPHKLEVFGDSITAGLADENTGLYTNATENGYLAFGPRLARLLDAEWHIEARGGGSFYNDFYLPMIPFFEKMFGPKNKENAPSDVTLWRFESWQPDVFILALGTNDFSDQYPHIDESAYVPKYEGFLQKLRGYYPKAEIFCLAPFKPGAPWDEARSYIAKAVMTLADPHMHAINPVSPDLWLASPTDFVSGDAFHPNLSGHQKIAAKLEATIRPVLGW
jgi:lysophospholipase L1-like esterase